MTSWARRIAATVAAIATSLILYSCASGPAPAAKGTPAFYWDAALKTYAAADYAKTMENLDSIVATENEFTGRARPWLMVMLSGMSKGNMEVAEYFENGGRVNKGNRLEFGKHVSQARGNANRLSLRFADVFAGYQSTKDDQVVLAFPFPAGSAGPVAALHKVGNGILPTPAEAEMAQKSAISRAVLLTACRVAGAPDDVAKGHQILNGAEVKVSRAAFTLAMAESLHDAAQLYTRNKLDDPEKVKILCGRAAEAVKMLPESKETKDLLGRIQTTLKRNKI